MCKNHLNTKKEDIYFLKLNHYISSLLFSDIKYSAEKVKFLLSDGRQRLFGLLRSVTVAWLCDFSRDVVKSFI